MDNKLSTNGSIQSEPASQSRFVLFKGDRTLWIIVAILAVLSILVVYSSTAKMAYDAYTKSSSGHFLWQQFRTLIFGFGALLVVQIFSSNFYRKISGFAYWLSIGLTILTYVIDEKTNGAARWIPIGSFQFQPSEMLKVTTVMYLAAHLASRQETIKKLRIIPSLRFWTWHSDKKQRQILREGTWPLLFPMLLSCCVILPAHTSSALLVFIVSLVILLIGRVNHRELWKLVGLACVGAVLLFALNLGRSDTAGGRIGTWLNLWTESQTEKPVDQITDTERSMIAIYNGGVVGKGAGQSTMRVEMIHPESDYAYAFVVEEYGIPGAILLLFLYLWLFFRSISISSRSHSAFAMVLVLGLGLLITCQALLHILVTVNLIPETGQTLPLISRGGSSTLFTAIALGMMLRVSRQNEETK